MLVESLNHFKSVVAHQFFVAPADNDYLIARWLLIQGFGSEFFWHAAQAIEKYFKASLVLNGATVRTINDGGHDLVNLYDRHLSVVSDLALQRFTRPQGINADLWREEAVAKFLWRTNLIGSPDGRYGLISSWRHRDDLFKFDQICWSIRRLAIGLDWIIGADFRAEPPISAYAGATYREALRAEPKFVPRGTPKNREATYQVGLDREDLLHAWNFEFRRCQADIFQPAPGPIAPAIGPLQNSYTYMVWELLTDTDGDGRPKRLDPHIEPGLRWMVEAIRLPKGVKEAFEAELARPRPT